MRTQARGHLHSIFSKVGFVLSLAGFLSLESLFKIACSCFVYSQARVLLLNSFLKNILLFLFPERLRSTPGGSPMGVSKKS